ncbi:lactate utilization protein C [Aneurinibacillus sp. Ricciae_BoGa-3]|uniref:LutC/YkgG family protein n=1 Tax=Aneurinibacillus sp. Ricciae_BoGa-3 TaxID=3022697 RepID=UPI002340E6E1|nr:lactate utilization protein C [Aneurinibacillus sp. Ricciae_BoGa-3]WCK53999.1 lactate utilization protein C [Aneurinibacillus sp. Ricciae_BoGa-3]
MSNQDIIRELDEQAKKKEDEFLNHLAARLKRPRITSKPDQPFRGAPDFWTSYELPPNERIKLFMDNWTSMGGVAERFADIDEAVAYIAELAGKMQAKYVVRFDDPVLEQANIDDRIPGTEMTIWNEKSQENIMAKAAGADIGIAVVDYGIAHTGTVVAVSGAKQGRSVSLLPTVFIAIVRASDIKTRMGEVMTDLQRRFGTELPAGVHFITGPSRSSDIENDLTIGVHGPGIVYALVID